MARENTTLSIDAEVKKSFKIATIHNKVDMSETVEAFMQRYVETTNFLRKQRAEKDEERTLVLEDYTITMNCSKWKAGNDYVEHFGQITPTMLEGGVVVGKAFVGSTVAAMSKGGRPRDLSIFV